MSLIVTPPGTFSYPHLFKPRPRAKDAEAVYSIMLLYTEKELMKSEAGKVLVAEIEKTFKERFPTLDFKKSVYKNPIRRADEKDDGKIPDEYDYFLNAWCREQPGIVDANKNRILTSDGVWAGQLGRISCAPFAFDNSGNKGVGLYLHNVQVIKSEGRKRLDGKKAAEDTFDDAYADADEEV